MNAIQMRVNIDTIIDRVKSARFPDDSYYQAINQAIQIIVDDTSESIKVPRKYSFQSSQRLRDRLYTLIATPTVTGVPAAGNVIPMPNDYYYLTLLQATVQDNFTGEKVTNNVRAITYGEQGMIDRNPFKKPKIYKTYFNERDGDWQLFIPPNSTVLSYSLDYLRRPILVSIGNERDKIQSGGTLIVGQKYYCYDDSVENSISYSEGDLFTAGTTSLTSGIVIPFAKVVNCDLPIEIHDEINRAAGAIMEDSLENYLKEASLDKQNQQY